MIVRKVDVNLAFLPRDCARANYDRRVTLGDLHGNVMKLVYSLIQEGILCEVSQKTYQKLYSLYQLCDKGRTPVGLQDEFWLLLNTGIVKPVARLRLLGDILMDRGRSDDLMLLVLRFLSRSCVPYTVMLSNHDSYFLRGLFSKDLRYICDSGAFVSGIDLLQRAQRVDKIEQVDSLVDFFQIYLRRLKLVDYELTENDAESFIRLFTHAPVGLETVEALAISFSLYYGERSPKDLARTIDDINAEFQYYLNKNPQAMIRRFLDVSDPINHVIWNRALAYEDGRVLSPGLQARVKSLRFTPDLVGCCPQKSYRIEFVHGHEGEVEPYDAFRRNLDTDLGRPDCDLGVYLVHRSQCCPDLYPDCALSVSQASERSKGPVAEPELGLEPGAGEVKREVELEKKPEGRASAKVVPTCVASAALLPSKTDSGRAEVLPVAHGRLFAAPESTATPSASTAVSLRDAPRLLGVTCPR